MKLCLKCATELNYKSIIKLNRLLYISNTIRYDKTMQVVLYGSLWGISAYSGTKFTAGGTWI